MWRGVQYGAVSLAGDDVAVGTHRTRDEATRAGARVDRSLAGQPDIATGMTLLHGVVVMSVDAFGFDAGEVVTAVGAAALCTLDEMEKLLILRVLRVTRGNRTAAAKRLGVARSTLFEMLKRHRIAGPMAKQIEPA